MRYTFAFPPSVFPSLQNLPLLDRVIQEAASNIQAPKELAFHCALSVIAISAQAVFDVEYFGMRRPISLAMGAIADSGERKSAMNSVFSEPIIKFDGTLLKQYHAKSLTYQVEKETYDLELRECKRAFKNKLRQGEECNKEKQAYVEKLKDVPKLPILKHFIFQDTTKEGLVSSMNFPKASCGLLTAEGGIMLSSRSFSDLTLFNSFWSAEKIDAYRKTSDPITLEDVRLSISFMVQPSTLFKFIENQGGEFRGNGFLSRCLIGYPITKQGYRHIHGAEPSWKVLPYFSERITSLLKASTSFQDDIHAKRSLVKFSGEATDYLARISNNIEQEIRLGGRYYGVGDHAGKLVENIARVAALFHIFEGFEGEIQFSTLATSEAVVLWYSNEFLRLFLPPPQEQVDAQNINGWFEQFRLGSIRYVKRNYVQQFCQNQLRQGKRLTAALDTLEIQGFILQFRLGKAKVIDLLPHQHHDPERAALEIFGFQQCR
jgi:hypothetical protein